jgi:hypothetical protein
VPPQRRHDPGGGNLWGREEAQADIQAAASVHACGSPSGWQWMATAPPAVRASSTNRSSAPVASVRDLAWDNGEILFLPSQKFNDVSNVRSLECGNIAK